MPPNQKLIQNYLSFKANPELAMFQALEKIKRDFETTKREIRAELLLELENTLAGLLERKTSEIKAELDPNMEKLIKNVLKDIKGENGYSPQKKVDYWTDEEINQIISEIQSKIRIPKDGQPGKNGYIPIAGKDYPTKEQIFNIIKIQVSKIKLPEPKEPNIPVAGIDYFTKSDIQNFISKVEEQIDMEKILQQLAELKKMIEEIKREKAFGGVQKSLTGGGGPSLVWNEAVGTGDDTTLIFTLANTPYSSSDLQVWVGGGIQFLTDDFNLSGRTITFITAPPQDAKIRATYRKA